MKKSFIAIIAFAVVTMTISVVGAVGFEKNVHRFKPAHIDVVPQGARYEVGGSVHYDMSPVRIHVQHLVDMEKIETAVREVNEIYFSL